MNYLEASKIITHKHELARKFTKEQAEFEIIDMNHDKPASQYAFRVEQCAGSCKEWHIRRGPNVFIAAR
jgi:hypothetical protein